MPHAKSSMRCSSASALAVLALLVTPSTAHSWIQQMMVVDPSNYKYVGHPGYARGNTLQTAPGFKDNSMVHILPSAGDALENRALNRRQVSPASEAIPPSAASVLPLNAVTSVDTTSIKSTDPMCKQSQLIQTQSAESPRLQAAAGDFIALQYQENGHVTLPENQPGKQPNRGNIYVYGTTQPKSSEQFLDVFQQWNQAGTGGDKRGKLLATGNFDDGQCYQENAGNISQKRQKEFPKAADTLMGTGLWCQLSIALPTDAPSGKPYTLYWVWDWLTEPGVDPGLPKGKAEIYTTCMDVDISGTKATRALEARAAPAVPGPSEIAHMAIAGQIKALMSPSPAAQPNAAPQASSPDAQAAPPPVASTPAAAPAAAQAAPPASSAIAAPAAPVASTPATPAAPEASTPSAAPAAGVATPAGNAAVSASEQVVASEFLAYLNQTVASKFPGAAGLLKSGGAAAPVTVTVTVNGAAAGAANAAVTSTSAAIVTVPTSMATIIQTMQTVYAASASVKVGAQAPPQAPAAAAPVASAPAAAGPAAPAGSQAPSMPPSSLVLLPPVTSGAPPAALATGASAPAASAAAPVAASPPVASAPASAEAGPPPMAPSITPQAAPAGSASTVQAMANAETASAASPLAASATASAAAAPVASSSPKIGTFTGTATAAAATMASAPKNGTAPAAGKRSCANKLCSKMAKRSKILPQK